MRLPLPHALITAKPKYKIDFVISTWVCYFFASILSMVIFFTAKCSNDFSLLIFPCGVLVDILRWRFAPELRISPYQRQCSFQRAKDDRQFRDCCRDMFNKNTASIYWCWWVLAFISLISGFKWVPNTMGISQMFYPFLRYPNLASQQPNVVQSVMTILKFVSLSWIFMLVAILAEISGGAFYYFHRPVPGLIVGRQSLVAESRLGIFRLFLAFFGLVVTYFFFALTSFTIAYHLSHVQADRSYLTNNFLSTHLYYNAIMSGFTLMCSAGCVRALYAYFLVRTSIVFPSETANLQQT